MVVIMVVISLNSIVLVYIQSSLGQHEPIKLPTTNKIWGKLPSIDAEILPARGDDFASRLNPEKRTLKVLKKDGSDRQPVKNSLRETRSLKILPPATPRVEQGTDSLITILAKKKTLAQSRRIFESEEDKTTPNELLQQSAIILLNTQSSCHVKQVLNSFHKDYADIPIVMALSKHTQDYCGRGKNTMCIKTSEHFCGERIPECGNNIQLIKLALRELKDVGYIFVWDAQLLYTESHSLALIAKRFVETRVKIIAPCIKEFCNLTTGLLHLSKTSNVLTSLPGIYPQFHFSTEALTCHLTEIFPSVFLTTFQTMLDQNWDESIHHTGQHTDFMLSIRRQKLAVAVCNDLEVTFTGTCPAERPINSFFAENWLLLSVDGFEKWNIKKIYNGLGTIFQPINGEITFSNTQWKSVRTNHMSNDQLDEKIVQTAIQHINDRSPGWENVRQIPESSSTKLSYMYVSPCVLRIEGSMVVEYDRHSAFRNKQIKQDVYLHTLNRTCDMFQDYWRLSKFGKLQRRQVYYATAVSNDTEYMERLLRMIDSQRDIQYTNIVIVDMGSPGPEQFNITTYKNLHIPIHYLHLGAPFSRSIGLRKGFDFALQVAQSMKHDNPILFAIDTSMIIPKDFTRRVWRSTRCGVSVYAPICYKEKSDSGYWSQFGYGMIGVCASDYQKSGGWDAKWGYHWGAEDVDLMHRLQDDLPYTVRVRESDYRHSRVENSLKYTKPYYKNKNVYPLPLPVTPLTRIVTDAALTNSLRNYAIKRMKYPIDLELLIVYQTALLPQYSGVMYDLRFRNQNNEEYYALIQSV